MVDWYPTLLKLAGASLEQKLPLDGMDAWPTHRRRASRRRTRRFCSTPRRRAAAIRVGDWKLVVNGGRRPTGDIPAPKKKKAKDGPESVELFNLAADLSEVEEPGRRTSRAR